jgi:dimethylamine/trimethylamine dehydrogenase
VIEAGITVHTDRAAVSVTADLVRTACVFTGSQHDHAADAVVLVTARVPIDDLYQELLARQGLRSVRAIGDAFAPGTIAAAVWAGREYAETLDAVAEPFRREF